MADWDVSIKGGRVLTTATLTDEEEAALEAALEKDPTKSKSRYYKFRRTILGKDAPDRIAALEAAGYRFGKPHWCGGDRVLYTAKEWERWDKANPEACATNPARVEQLAEPEPEPEPKLMPVETQQWGKVHRGSIHDPIGHHRQRRARLRCPGMQGRPNPSGLDVADHHGRTPWDLLEDSTPRHQEAYRSGAHPSR